MTDQNNALQKFRENIDDLDNQILDLLCQRIDIVKQVGEFKRNAGMSGSIIRPGREAVMVRSVTERMHPDFPKAAIAQIWRMIISGAINVEENARVSTVSRDSSEDCYWLAREYFGPFTPTEERPSGIDVLHDVRSGHATIGVLPLWESHVPSAWWSRIAEEHADLKIFATLPFIRTAYSSKVPLVSIGHVKPEATGNDESLWVLSAEERVQFTALESYLVQHGLEYAFLGSCRVMNVPTQHHYLVKIIGFVDGSNTSMQKAIEGMNSQHSRPDCPVNGHHLGSYAVPMLCS